MLSYIFIRINFEKTTLKFIREMAKLIVRTISHAYMDLRIQRHSEE